MSSVRFCHSWKAETKYICLICQGPACNRPDCAVFLSEEAPNWKSGSCASACLSCNINSDLKLNDDAKQDVAMIAPQASNSQSGEKPRKRALHTSAAKETSKRNCLSLQQRVQEKDDPFSEGEDELPALQELLNKVRSSCDAKTFISAEESIDVCLGYIDDSDPNWKNDLREQIIDEDVMFSASSEKREITNDIKG